MGQWGLERRLSEYRQKGLLTFSFSWSEISHQSLLVSTFLGLLSRCLINKSGDTRPTCPPSAVIPSSKVTLHILTDWEERGLLYCLVTVIDLLMFTSPHITSPPPSSLQHLTVSLQCNKWEDWQPGWDAGSLLTLTGLGHHNHLPPPSSHTSSCGGPTMYCARLYWAVLEWYNLLTVATGPQPEQVYHSTEFL